MYPQYQPHHQYTNDDSIEHRYLDRTTNVWDEDNGQRLERKHQPLTAAPPVVRYDDFPPYSGLKEDDAQTDTRNWAPEPSNFASSKPQPLDTDEEFVVVRHPENRPSGMIPRESVSESVSISPLHDDKHQSQSDSPTYPVPANFKATNRFTLERNGRPKPNRNISVDMTAETTIEDIPRQQSILSHIQPSAAVSSSQHAMQVDATNGSDTENVIPGGFNPALNRQSSMFSQKTANVRNILVFGETGTGKSSLINMCAGRELAEISSSAIGCTFSSRNYAANIDGQEVKLWDTAGLNEGEHGTIPAQQAAENLYALIRSLSPNGLHLLVYCIRGSRYRDILRLNYDLFYGALCQKEVPIVAVVTGLENEDPMESWWDVNRADLKKHGLKFHDHACVTTTKGKRLKSGGFLFEEEYAMSEIAVKRLIKANCNGKPKSFEGSGWMEGFRELWGTYQTNGRNESVSPNLASALCGILAHLFGRAIDWLARQ
ncbi:P-loop containing nucleoside triphosphate hydrolase protein [Hygrophoropsis aurantiaca]|uniref:P-loop containing nucleoside triphosphate hydrolase protein n=1 Tax=Hygrophoropsis aurantiaca TaxID=72124 RepID=A0ACB8A5C4_9AGAM|nr:P-loop containing nucleoside triphosphate hydrolase protein [Hygrophoropsis aurantiaca]